MLPRRAVTLGAGCTEGRPVAVIEKDLQAAPLGKLSRLDVKDDDPGLCDRDLQRGVQGAATTYDERGARPLTCAFLRSSASHRSFHRLELAEIPHGCSPSF
jgi:hypothetical protein